MLVFNEPEVLIALALFDLMMKGVVIGCIIGAAACVAILIFRGAIYCLKIFRELLREILRVRMGSGEVVFLYDPLSKENISKPAPYWLMIGPLAGYINLYRYFVDIKNGKGERIMYEISPKLFFSLKVGQKIGFNYWLGIHGPPQIISIKGLQENMSKQEQVQIQLVT